jgi:uncharacterized protein (DUF2384 family)
MSQSDHAMLSPCSDDGALVGKAALRTARILGLTNAVLAKVLGLSASQISRLDHGHTSLDVGSKAFELALLLVRLFRGLSGIIGADDRAAQSWLQAPNRALRGRPIDLIQTISGLMEVVAYVDSRRARI